MSNPTLKDYLDTVICLAKDAGLMMMSTSGKNTKIDEKANFRDLVRLVFLLIEILLWIIISFH